MFSIDYFHLVNLISFFHLYDKKYGYTKTCKGQNKHHKYKFTLSGSNSFWKQKNINIIP